MLAGARSRPLAAVVAVLIVCIGGAVSANGQSHVRSGLVERCQGPAAPKTPTGRSSSRSGGAIFVGYCRGRSWYVGAKIDGRPAAPFAVANAKVDGRSPCCGVEILVVARLPAAHPVALVRVGLGLFNGFDYLLFAVVDGRVAPVTVGDSGVPLVLSTHSSAGWGEGIRCSSERGRLAVDQYHWNTADLDSAERVKVQRWRYRFEPPAAARFRRPPPIFVPYRAESRLAAADCFGAHDPVS